MLFYASLLLASLTVTLVLLWLYKLMAFVSRKVFRSNYVHTDQDGHKVDRSLGRDLKYASGTWGRRTHQTPGNLARTHPATSGKAKPWGWPVQDHENNEFQPKPASSKQADLSAYLSRHDSDPQSSPNWRRDIGRPVRDDRPTFSSSPQKMSNKTKSKNQVHKDNDKPWGW